MITRSYRSILREAFAISLKRPFLWLLGLLASFSLSTGIYSGITQNIVTLLQSNDIFSDIQSLYQVNQIDSLFTILERETILQAPNFITLVIAIAVLFAVIYITTLAQIAIIQKASKIVKDRKIDPWKSLPNANKKFPEVLIINIGSKILYSLIIIITSAPILLSLASNNQAAIVLSTLVFFFLFIPLTVLLSLMTIYTILYAVLKDTGIKDSIIKGYILLKENFILSLELFVTLLIIKFGTYVTTIIIASILFIPIGIFVLSLVLMQNIAPFAIAITFAAIIGVTIYLFITGWYSALYIVTLTLLFESFESRNLSSKLLRTIDKIADMLHLSTLEKREVKKAARKINVKADQAIDTAERVAEELKPTITKILEEASTAYDEYEPELKRMEAQISKIIEKEKKEIIPTLKAASTIAEEDIKKAVAKARPRVKKEIKKATNAVEKKYPQLLEIKNKLQERYQEELEKELAKVEVKEEPTQKKSPKKKSTTKKSSSKKKSTTKKTTPKKKTTSTKKKASTTTKKTSSKKTTSKKK